MIQCLKQAAADGTEQRQPGKHLDPRYRQRRHQQVIEPPNIPASR